MNLNEYQDAAMTTCMKSCKNLPYMLFNLQGEVGELSSKIAKHIRHGELNFSSCTTHEGCNQMSWNTVNDRIPDEAKEAIIGELGDCAWMLVGVCKIFGLTFEEVCQKNLDKLASRKRRNVIDGNGDNR